MKRNGFTRHFYTRFSMYFFEVMKFPRKCALQKVQNGPELTTLCSVVTFFSEA